ncbi:hypothetical protein [Almyronema epifaneia]|uniref:Uncharacterized protein n=1 Tax=Almyronema epifaneia S1 TaxID=2991925 RepID=A0ABW6IFL2_9CYAN
MFDRLQTNLAESWHSVNQTVSENFSATVKGVSSQAARVVEMVESQAQAAANGMTEMAGDRFESIGQNAEPISRVNHGFQAAIATSLQTWLTQHPAIAWMVGHPLWTLALLLIGLLSVWGLLGAIAQFVRQVWVGLLSLPLRLLKWLLVKIFRLFKQADALQRSQTPKQADLPTRLLEILSRLESLRQEQDALIQEMQAILAAKGIESAKTQ